MTDQPVITVDVAVMDGTVVRWFRSLSAAETNRPTLSASRQGVMVHGEYLTSVPEAWIEAAKTAHRQLTRAPRADMTGLATHARRKALGVRSGPLDPISKEQTS